ncbi:eCIS core domain-containing protein [Streptomyces sp. NBC_00388]|uniref:eCIS core domain-containing protein n=1 Tax=Streptomyces sp. NBC_00388 TaxID=2975735 RepID=UPI002E21A9A1
MESAQREAPEGKRGTARHQRPAEPARTAPRGILGLQSTAGNAAVVQMLRQAGHEVDRELHEHGAGCGHQAATPAVQRSTAQDVLRQPGSPLESGVRAEMEARFDTGFSDVRIHAGSAAQASAADLGARAYTSGSHVVIGQGGGDKHTLAHELTHVIQQRQGPVAGTDNGSGLRVSDPSDRFEREAEENAHRVMSGSVSARTSDSAGSSAGGGDTSEEAQPTISRAIQRAYGGRHKVSYASSSKSGVGSYMKAELHPASVKYGGKPKVKPSWWPKKGTPTGDWFAKYMVQGHLLNDNLGGPGDTLDNLTPLTKGGNRKHHEMTEYNVKDEIKAGRVVVYTVEAVFDGQVTGASLGASGAVAAEIDKYYAQSIPTYLNCQTTVYDPKTGKEMYGEGWIVHNTMA